MGRRRLDYDRIRRLHADGANDTQVAAVLGCTPEGIGAARRKLGLQSNRPRGHPWTADEDAALLADESDADTAAKIGRTVPAVMQRRRILGIARGPAGGGHYTGRWTDAESAAILNEPAADAAKKVGRNRQAIWQKRHKMRREGRIE